MLEKIVLKKLNIAHRDAIRTALTHEKATIGIGVSNDEDEVDEDGILALAMAEDLVKLGVFEAPNFVVSEDKTVHVYTLTALGKRVGNRMVEEEKEIETVYLQVRNLDHRERWIKIERFPMKLFEAEQSLVEKFVMLKEHVPIGTKPVKLQRGKPEGFKDEQD